MAGYFPHSSALWMPRILCLQSTFGGFGFNLLASFCLFRCVDFVAGVEDGLQGIGLGFRVKQICWVGLVEV